MDRIIKAEIFKLLRSKTFKTICIICIIQVGFIASVSNEYIINKLIRPQIENQKNRTVNREVFTGKVLYLATENPLEPTVREVFHSSFSTGILEVLISMLVVGLFIKEYTEKTIKNTLAYGVNRRKFYLAKFISLLIGVSIFISILTGTGIILGSIFIKGWGEAFVLSQVGSMIFSMISGIVVSASVISIIMLLSILIKNSAGVIGISVAAFIFLPNFISFAYGKIEWFDRLFKLTPFYNMSVAVSIYSQNLDKIMAIIIAIITTSIFLFIGSKVFEKQDIV